MGIEFFGMEWMCWNRKTGMKLGIVSQVQIATTPLKAVYNDTLVFFNTM